MSYGNIDLGLQYWSLDLDCEILEAVKTGSQKCERHQYTSTKLGSRNHGRPTHFFRTDVLNSHIR
jgi:hypothetical protein